MGAGLLRLMGRAPSLFVRLKKMWKNIHIFFHTNYCKNSNRYANHNLRQK
jgi:hypothetical protein